MGPFISPYSVKYILVAVDYVSKLVEAVTFPNNESKSVVHFLRQNIFSRFGTPRTIMRDGGSHFYKKIFHVVLAMYGV